MGGAQFDHLAGTDEEHALLGDRFEDALRQPHRRRGHRHGMRADLGGAAYLLGDREGALEQLIQVRAQRAGFGGGAHRVFHLAEDLRLAQHHGIEPAGHAEGVAHGLRLPQRIHVGRQFAGVDVVVVGQPADGVLVGGVFGQVAVGRAVELGAVAGGEDGGLGRALAVRQMLAQRAQRGLELLERKRHLLAQGKRRRMVVDSEGEQLHVGAAGRWRNGTNFEHFEL